MKWVRMIGQERMGLRNGFTLWVEDIEAPGCSNGHYPAWKLSDPYGDVVAGGRTCGCGRGCANTDCIYDAWGYHDTCIEEWREQPGAPAWREGL